MAYYRPKNVLRNDPHPCLKCQCDSFGSEGTCLADEDEALLLGKVRQNFNFQESNV